MRRGSSAPSHHARIDHVDRRLRSRLTVAVDLTSTQRLDHVQHLLATAVIPIMPRITSVAGAGSSPKAPTASLRDGPSATLDPAAATSNAAKAGCRVGGKS